MKRILAIAFTLSFSAAATAKGPAKVYVMAFDAPERDQALAKLVAQEVAAYIDADDAYKVVTEREVSGLVKHAEQRMRLGCQDETCTLESFAGVVDVAEVVVGNVTVRNGQALLFLARLKPADQSVLSRSSSLFDAAKAASRKQAINAASRHLIYPETPSGDEVLSALRIGIVVDDYAPDGKKLRHGRVGECLAKGIRDAGGITASPLQINRIRKVADPKSALEGDALSAVKSKDADVLLIGTTEWEIYADAPNMIAQNVKSYQGTLGYTLVTVSSGEVIASDTLNARSPGYSFTMAEQKVRPRLCDKVLPDLQKQLNQRIDRGTRIVVDVQGVKTGKPAQEFMGKLKKLPRVSRVRLVDLDNGGARYDVWMRGGDGVRLAQVEAPLGTDLVSASSSRVVLKAR